jgi:hypothetical protein
MTAWRPPYHPQLGQTTWGNLPLRHCGHVLRGGAARLHALARRLRLFAFDVFFFGTAMKHRAYLLRRESIVRLAAEPVGTGCRSSESPERSWNWPKPQESRPFK